MAKMLQVQKAFTWVCEQIDQVQQKLPIPGRKNKNDMAEPQSKKDNFLRQFRDMNTKGWKKFTAQQFMEVWSHYDTDGNGYIEGEELDAFLKEFITSVNEQDVGKEVISETQLQHVKEVFMDAFDENEDNKIDIGELAQILPTEETFLLLFRRENPLESSIEFMKIWKAYDKDCSGYIEADELKEFLGTILRKEQHEVSDDKLIEYTDTMLQLFDKNKDGKLQLSEMTKLLPVKENFLRSPVFTKGTKITKTDIDKIFRQYDKNRDGTIENDELLGFLRDLLELIQEDYDDRDLQEFKKAILGVCDLNNDGKIDRNELTMIMLQYNAQLEMEDE